MGKILGYYIMPHPPIIVDEVGKDEVKKAQSTISACLKIATEVSSLAPDTIIIITPHGPMFSDAIALTDYPIISGSFKNFDAAQLQYELKIDLEITNNLKNLSMQDNINLALINPESSKTYNMEYELDHGCLVPLYFINKKYKNFKIVHITYGLLSNDDLYKFGILIRKSVAASKNNAIVIASGDLSHKLSKEAPYGYSPQGELFDEKIVQLLIHGDVESIFNLDKKFTEDASECGLRSFYILLGSMDGNSIQGELLSYEAPFGVGYGVLRFNIKENKNISLLQKIKTISQDMMNITRKNEETLVRLARDTLEHYIRKENCFEIPSYINQDLLDKKRGVFVSLKKNNQLRGCIGTIYPCRDNICLEIMNNAIDAGTKDPRFPPIEEYELQDIVYSIDELQTPVKAEFKELDPKKYGVIVRCGNKSGVLLPDLDGVDTAKDQVEIAMSKANIYPYEKYELEKFEVIRHK